MLPIHLLVQNLLYDFSQMAVPFDRVDEDVLRQPLKWEPTDIGRFMLYFGPISSVFDILTFLILWFGFAANSVAQQGLFQSGWFLVGLVTQTVIVHMIRTSRIPFIESRSAPVLMLASLAIVSVGIFLPMGPLAGYFKLQPLPLTFFPVLLGIVLGYMVLTQMMKGFYIRHFGWH
jgi:Mg2+-importing ATPase